MRKRGTGTVVFSRGRWFAQLSLDGKRKAFRLWAGCASREEALARLNILGDVASRMTVAGCAAMVPAVLKRIADRDGVQLERALAGVAPPLCAL